MIQIGTAFASYAARQLSGPYSKSPETASSRSEPDQQLTTSGRNQIPGTFNLSGLLSSGMVSEVIKVHADGSLAFVDPHRVLTDQEWLARRMLETQEALESGRASAGSVEQHIAEADKALFKEMTGYNYVTLDGGVCVVDDQGNLAPSSPCLEAAIRLLSHASTDRMLGSLEGEITGEYARAVFDRYAKADKGFDKDLTDTLIELINR